ncbi:MFS transporter [Dactylosporangium maewongense]|uniref:MFS transporter n=2 Tax=Dactylosporangium maewongense TaxID=634393 RepID=A0ABN2B0K9_9ACTN
MAMDTARRWTVLAICSTSLFLVGLDTTIVNVALPSIGAGLHVGTRGLEWTVDAYTLVLASLLISSGALADRFGRRRIFQIGLVVFALASVACAAAPSLGWLVAARVVQGVGGSMLSPVALAIVVSVITDPKERAQAIGVWAAIFGASMAAGPVAGGALVSALGWRSVFWVSVPLIAAVLALTALYVPESRSPQPRPVDVPGQVLLVALTGGSVALLIEAPHAGWTAPVSVCLSAVTLAAAAGFVVTSLRRRSPLFDVRLFRHAPFTAAVLGAVVLFAGLNLTLLLSTLYLQHTRGLSPAAAGLVTLPMALAATVCAPLSGYLVGRAGPRPPLLLAGAFVLAGGLCLATLSDDTALPVLLLAFLLLGVGIGFANTPITNTAVAALPPSRSGVAGGITSTARQFGAALGIAVAGGLVASSSPAGLPAASRPGWLLVATCGAVLLAVAKLSPTLRTTPQPTTRPATSHA